MTNGNGELSDDAKGRGVTVQECEGAGVRWRWGATGLRRERDRVRRCGTVQDGAGRCRMVRDGVGWCGTALDGTTGRKRAQPGATGRRGRKRAQPGATGRRGRNRAQPGATGRRRGSRRLANPVKLGAPPALCGRVEQICTEAARAAAQRRRRELLKWRRSPTP